MYEIGLSEKEKELFKPPDSFPTNGNCVEVVEFLEENKEILHGSIGTSTTMVLLPETRTFGYGYYLTVSISRTLNISEGDTGYNLDFSGDGVSFSSSGGGSVFWQMGHILSAGVRIGQAYELPLDEDTVISYSSGVDLSGSYLTYSYDNTKRSRMIDNLTLRLRRDEGQIKKAKEYGLLAGAGLVGGKIIVAKAVL